MRRTMYVPVQQKKMHIFNSYQKNTQFVKMSEKPKNPKCLNAVYKKKKKEKIQCP